MSVRSKFPTAVLPYDHTVFMLLKDGEAFRFATELTFPHSGLKTGVAQKVSNLKYRYIDDGTENHVGSINATVIRVDKDGQLKKREPVAVIESPPESPKKRIRSVIVVDVDLAQDAQFFKENAPFFVDRRLTTPHDGGDLSEPYTFLGGANAPVVYTSVDDFLADLAEGKIGKEPGTEY